jgi:hypothetical protein
LAIDVDEDPTEFEFYEGNFSDDRLWTVSELTYLMNGLQDRAEGDGRVINWTSLNTWWNEDAGHWILRVGLYPPGF